MSSELLKPRVRADVLPGWPPGRFSPPGRDGCAARPWTLLLFFFSNLIYFKKCFGCVGPSLLRVGFL